MLLQPSLYLALLCTCLLWPYTTAFHWGLKTNLKHEHLTLSEGYMFASHHGPAFLENDASYLKTIFEARVKKDDLQGEMKVDNIKVLAYHSTVESTSVSEVDLCASEVTFPKNSDREKLMKFKLFPDPMNTNESVTLVHMDYHIHEEGPYYVMIQPCPSESYQTVAIDGFIEFKNPYGFLPGVEYGLLLFEGARSLVFFLVFAAYGSLVLYHRSTVVLLNYSVLCVLAMAFLESLFWFLTYRLLNENGEPFCCPFPSILVVSMVLQCLRQTMSRFLVLIVCLGYKTVRETLSTIEWGYIWVLTFFYLAAALLDQMALLFNKDVNLDAHVSIGWEIPLLITDCFFLSWLYVSLSHTIEILTVTHQAYKHYLFSTLHTVIVAFSLLFGVLTMLVALRKQEVLSVSWKFLWVESVSWSILNFGVIVAVAVLFRPSNQSKLLSSMSQLPMSEEEADDIEMMERRGGGHHLSSMFEQEFDVLRQEDDMLSSSDEDEYEYYDDDDEDREGGGTGRGRLDHVRETRVQKKEEEEEEEEEEEQEQLQDDLHNVLFDEEDDF